MLNLSDPALPDPLAVLGARLTPAQLARRLAREREVEHRARRRAARLGGAGGWLAMPALVRAALRLSGLGARARRNALAIERRDNIVRLPGLPPAFDGFTLLQLTDLHLDISPDIPEAVADAIAPLRYDLCVLTGDYRAATYGPCEPALDGLRRLGAAIAAPAYAVLGNHDSIAMVPAIEAMGIRTLLNEAVRIERGDASIHLAGIDDAEACLPEDIDRAAAAVPPGASSILLSHRPDVYARAAARGFGLMLSGHTHGGQICLPGGIPIRTDSRSPRRFARGAWRHGPLAGYTSAGAGCCIVDARLNCPPEVTLHHLRHAPPQGEN